MRFVKQFLAVAAVAAVGGQVVTAVRDTQPWLALVLGLLSAVGTVLVYRWVVRRTEHREVTELAGAGATGRLLRGTLIGFAMFGVVLTNLAVNADVDVHGIGSVPGMFGLLGFMAAAAVSEELLFRGVLFRIIEEKIGSWLALLATGVVFGAAHLLNPDATLWGATAIAVEAGFMLAACFVATRNLWVPIGLHFGWNFALGGIFSAAVSGNGDSKGLLDVTLSGSSFYTGGDFGPEGGIATVGTGVLLTIIFMAIAHRRGHIVARRRGAEVEPGRA